MSVTVEEKSLQLALVKAAGLLSITQDLLEHKVLEKKNGIFGIFGKKILIEAWKKGDRRARPSLRSAANPEPIALSPKEIQGLKNELVTSLQTLCKLMTGSAVTVTSDLQEDRLVLNIEDQALAEQVAKNGKLAEALEHILRKCPKHLKQELPFRVFLDAKGIRREREENLIEMAQDLSAKVFENKKPVVLNYKSSYDRKIIHMALDKDDRVYTKSIGSGNNRKLMILPSSARRDTKEASYMKA